MQKTSLPRYLKENPKELLIIVSDLILGGISEWLLLQSALAYDLEDMGKSYLMFFLFLISITICGIIGWWSWYKLRTQNDTTKSK